MFLIPLSKGEQMSKRTKEQKNKEAIIKQDLSKKSFMFLILGSVVFFLGILIKPLSSDFSVCLYAGAFSFIFGLILYFVSRN